MVNPTSPVINIPWQHVIAFIPIPATLWIARLNAKKIKGELIVTNKDRIPSIVIKNVKLVYACNEFSYLISLENTRNDDIETFRYSMLILDNDEIINAFPEQNCTIIRGEPSIGNSIEIDVQIRPNFIPKSPHLVFALICSAKSTTNLYSPRHRRFYSISSILQEEPKPVEIFNLVEKVKISRILDCWFKLRRDQIIYNPVYQFPKLLS